VAREGEARAAQARTKKLDRSIRKVNHLVNALNIKLHKALRQDDTSFVSRTMLESTPYRPQNIVVLRAVLINPLTEKPLLHEIAETQRRLGMKIWKNFEPAYERLLWMKN
jgi:hypothetical protein